MSKADNKSYDNTHEESEKKSSSIERVVSSSSSSTENSGTVRRVLKGREERIGKGGVSLPDRFFDSLKVKYDATLEKVKRAKWFLKHKAVLELVNEMGIVWGSRLFRILQDMGYKISKSVVFDLLDALDEFNIIYDYEFHPKSKNMHYQRFYITFDCPIDRIERYIGRIHKKDEWEIGRSVKKTPKEIVEHNIEVKKQTKIANELLKKEEKQKLKEENKCEHDNYPQECKNSDCPNSRFYKRRSKRIRR